MKADATTPRPFWTRRRFYLPILLGALVNGLIYVAVTHRLATKQERLTREQATLTGVLDAAKKELAGIQAEQEKLIRNEEMADRFWSETVKPRDPGLTEAIAELAQLADDAGVEHGRSSYNYEDLDVGLVQVNASIPVEGSYFNLVRFVNMLERSSRFFLVREIGLSGRRGRATDAVSLGCDVVFFLKGNESQIKQPAEAKGS